MKENLRKIVRRIEKNHCITRLGYLNNRANYMFNETDKDIYLAAGKCILRSKLREATQFSTREMDVEEHISKVWNLASALCIDLAKQKISDTVPLHKRLVEKCYRKLTGKNRDYFSLSCDYGKQLHSYVEGLADKLRSSNYISKGVL